MPRHSEVFKQTTNFFIQCIRVTVFTGAEERGLDVGDQAQEQTVSMKGRKF